MAAIALIPKAPYRVPLLVAAVGLLVFLLTSSAVTGLTGQYFSNTEWAGVPLVTSHDRAPSLDRLPRQWFPDRYSIAWSGFIDIPRDGSYTFATVSDDASELWVDNQRVVDNLGFHAALRAEGTVKLAAGLRPIRIRYAQGDHAAVLTVTWKPAETGDAPEQPLSSAVLFPRRPASWAIGVGRTAPFVRQAAPWLAAAMLITALALSGRLTRPRLSALPSGASLVRVAHALVDASAILTFTLMFWCAIALFPSPPLEWMYSDSFRSLDPGALLAVLLLLGFLSVALPRQTAPAVVPAAADRIREWLTLVVRRIGTARLTAVVALVLSLALGILGIATWQSGLTGRYFASTDWSGSPEATWRDREVTRRRGAYDYFGAERPYSIEWRGFFHADRHGEYRFAVTTEGTTQFSIGSQVLIDSTGPKNITRHEAAVRLAPGLHELRATYGRTSSGGGAFFAEWAPSPSAPLRPLSGLRLVPPAADPLRAERYLRQVTRVRDGLLILLGVACTIGLLFGAVWCWQLLAQVTERQLYIGLLALLAIGCYGAGLRVHQLWGISKMAAWPALSTIPFVFLALSPMLLLHKQRSLVTSRARALEQWLAGRPWAVVAGALMLIPVFWLFRNGFVNSDGVMYRWMVIGVANGEVDYNFDEMLEQYFHVALWQYGHARFGYPVRWAYEVLSSVAGAAFMVTLWFYARRLIPGAAVAFVLLMAAGGYMQLFFGDVENYALVTVAILGYLFASERYLRAGLSLVIPVGLLALAMAFHMLAGFLFPSLIVLVIVSMRRRRYLPIAAALVAFLAVITLTMTLLGKPLEALYRGSWGASAVRELALAGSGVRAMERDDATRWAMFAFDQYHLNQYNLFLLLLPAHLLIVPLVVGRRIRMDVVNVHLLAAAAGMLFFHFNYRAMLPIDHDWNLFAAAPIPLAILIWRSLLSATSLQDRAVLVAGWGTLCALHSYSWILANHRYIP